MPIYGGKNGSVTISIPPAAPVPYGFGKWVLAIDGDDPEVTNFISGGFYEDVEGIEKGTLTLTGPWNVGNCPLTRGQIYTFNCGVGGGVTVPVSARVRNIRPGQEVKGNSTVEVTAVTQGSFQTNIT